MQSNLPGLVVDVEARIDKLEKGLKRANTVQRRQNRNLERRADQSAKRMQQSYGNAGASIQAMFKKIGPGLVAGLAAGVTVGALSGIQKQLAQVAKETASIGDEAKRAGVGVQAFQQWKFVAEQSRIGVDALTDGLKELALRSDEFIVTGKGPAAEAFDRLGFRADELKTKLKDPSALLLDIIGRLSKFDKAAQIRISDEIFGGSAGERFVELIDTGEVKLRGMIDAAHDAGAVLDEALIVKAAEIDRRFGALETRIGNFFKEVAIGAGDTALSIAGIRTELEDLFGEAQGKNLLGSDIANALKADADTTHENREALETLNREYDILSGSIRRVSTDIGNELPNLIDLGFEGQALALSDLSGELDGLIGDWRAQKISAEEFEARLRDIVARAGDATTEIDALGGVDLSFVITEIDTVSDALEGAARRAKEARVEIGKAVGVEPEKSPRRVFQDAESASNENFEGFKKRMDAFLNTEKARNSLTKDQLALENEVANVRKRASDAGTTLTDAQARQIASDKLAGDKARQPVRTSRASRPKREPIVRQSDFEREVLSISEETAALTIEATALAESTQAQIERGDAIDLARTKSDLLSAAVRSGVTDTPALRTQVDQLANAYQNAANGAEVAASRIDEVQSASADGAASIADVFGQMATGALSAGDAVKSLILQVVALTLKKRILAAVEGASGTGSFFGNVLGVLGSGFAEGGYTGAGAKNQPAGMVHRGEFVLSANATKRLGVGNLEALHSAALKGYSGGGHVGGASSAHRLVAPPAVGSGGDIHISAPVTVNGSAGSPEQNNDLAKKMSREMESTMRGVVVNEIRTQMRNGNILSRRK